MGDIISALKENWSVIEQAPAAAITWALVIGAIAFFVMRAVYANQIADLNSRLALRDDEIRDYQRKLDGASPDEAKARIDELEKRISTLQLRRRLTDAQKRAIGDTVRGVALPFSEKAHEKALEIIYPSPSEEAAVFAHDFAEAFNAGGWVIEPAYMMGINRIRHFGLTVGVGSLDAKPEIAEVVAKALSEAGLAFSWEETDYLSESGRTRLFVDMAGPD